MKKADLIKALNVVAPGLAPKEIVEQSNSFVFINGRVGTWNDEIAVSYPIDIGFEGAVQSKELLALLSKVKDDDIKVYFDNGEFRVDGKKFQSGIRMDQEISLPLDFLNTEVEWTKLPSDFLAGLKICMFSTASEKFSIMLSNIHAKGNILESCDNYRMTRYTMSSETDEMLVPAASARHLINNSFDLVGTTPGWLHFSKEGGDVMYSCRTYEDPYHNLDQWMNMKGNPIRLPEELKEVLARSNVFSFSDGLQDQVLVTINSKEVIVRGENEHGWLEERADVKMRGKQVLRFRVSAAIMRDILSITNKATVSEEVMKFVAKGFDHVVILLDPDPEKENK